MRLRYLSLGAGLGTLAACLALPAAATADLHAAAVDACVSANAHQPASAVTAIEDGRGGSLVWVNDANAGLWLCSAGADGEVFSYSAISGDLLAGAGAGLADNDPIFIDPVTDDGAIEAPDRNPIDVAASACQATLPGEAGKVIGSGLDGLDGTWVPGYFVFIQTGKGDVFLCDATADAQVWVLAKIGDPLAFDPSIG